MTLQRISIDDVTAVAAGTTSTIITVSNAQTTYKRTLILHAASLGSNTPETPATVQVHIVPNNMGSVGDAVTATRIARINLAADDTFFVEPEYPIILSNNGDSIQIFNEGSYNTGSNSYSINVLAMGDREI